MRRLWSVPMIGCAAALATLGAGLLAAALDRELVLDALGTVTSVAAVLVAGAVVLRGRPGTRSAWTFVLLVLVAWVASDTGWGVPFHDPQATGPGVAVLLAGYGCALVALGLAARRRRPDLTRERVSREVADVAAVAICVLLVTSLLVLRPFLGGEAAALPAATLAVPLLSFVIAALSYLVSRLAAEHEVSLHLLSAAFTTVALSDIASVASLASGSVSPATSAGYAAASVLVVAAGLSALGLPGSFGPAVERLGGRVVAAIPEVIVVGTATVGIVVGLSTPLDWTLAPLGGVVVMWRAATQAYESRRTRLALEVEVSERTGELRRLTRRYARILDTVREGIVGLDQRAHLTFVNAAAAAHLGLDRDAVLGRHVCEVLCDPHGREGCRFVAVAGGHGRLEGWRTSLRRVDGSHLPVELDAAPKVWPGAGEAEGAVVAFRDITDQLTVEQHKQQFVSSVSHELRTPLASIRGVLELLGCGDAGELSPAAYRLVATAERGAQRLTRLVGDIIDAERLATGDFDVVPVRHDVGSVVRDAVGSLRPLARQADVEVRLTHVDDVDALCDADRIEQAIVNLIGNAVKFSERDGVVEVSVRARGLEVEVEVRDHGRGIPAADLPLVFDRFRQVRTTDATEKGGTGLGLTITRSIVERHGGRIRVESTEGEGATFVFTLPRALEPVPSMGGLRRGPVGVDHAS